MTGVRASGKPSADPRIATFSLPFHVDLDNMAAMVRAFKQDRETLRQLLLTLDGFTTLGGPQPKRTFVICTVAAIEVSDQRRRCRRQSSRSLGIED